MIMGEDERRRFNSRQRVALYLAQNGLCAICKEELTPGWHGDHMQPWSKGGSTDVINGQALCASCNLKKGRKEIHKNMGKELRPWQKRALRQYVEDAKRDWLASVCPAGGKTFWALTVVKGLLQDEVIERLVIVVPSEQIRVQWIKSADELDIDLAFVKNLDGGLEKRSNYHGVVLTYQQVASNPDLHRLACGRYKTAVIFDEVHHAGDNQSWGTSIENAFTPAIRRIAMTGTPWTAPRSGKIPFVTYDAKGYVKADFTYTYKEALKNNVCRAVSFPAYDGNVTYVEVTAECCVPQRSIMRLGEVEDDDSQVLRDILSAQGKWMPSIFREAHQALQKIVIGDDDQRAMLDAKGIVFAQDRFQARAIVELVTRIMHERPALIISDPAPDEPDPKDELKRFAKSTQRWAVAVDMVSEGVDIPALFVGVYATRKKTRLRFLQIVGRFTRKRADDEPEAILLLPAVPSLLTLAAEVEAEKAEVWLMAEEEEKGTKRERNRNEYEQKTSVYTTSDAILDRVIHSGAAYTDTDIRSAALECEEFGLPTKYALNLLKYKRAHGQVPEVVEVAPAEQDEDTERMTTQEKEIALRQLLKKEIGRIAAQLVPGDKHAIAEAITSLNKRMVGWYGKKRNALSIEQLQDALRRVRALASEDEVVEESAEV